MTIKKSINELTPQEAGLVKTVCNTILALLIAVFVLMTISLLTIPFHALLLKLCWNYVMPNLFHLPKIGYLQSLALVIIARILVKSTHNEIKT